MRRWRAAWLLWLLIAACGDDGGGGEPVDLGGEEDDPPRAVEIVLTEPPAEAPASDPLAPAVPKLRDVVRHLEAIAERDEVKGVLLRLGVLRGAWGRGEDLVGALQRVREAGKPVHCHFELLDNVGYMVLARACDRISMTPAGHLELVGPAAQMFFAQTLLSNIGVDAEVVQVGRYKGAAEPVTRDEMSPATREAMTAILDDLHGLLARAIRKGRGISATRARELIDGGPYGAGGAREAGLIDDVGFDDEARQHLREAAGVDDVPRIDLLPSSEPMGLTELVQALAGDEPRETPEGKRIALVLLEGTIVDAERPGLGSARSGPFVRAMRRLGDDDRVKAIVIRIDSPGGSALASDRMWHAVRRAAKRKPVIASVGDMAASGGYYVAAAADEVLAHDGSLVGSIGVVGGKVDVSGLAERLGINVQTLKRGKHAAWSSPVKSLTDEERKMLKNMLWRAYSRFLRRIESGRGMSRDSVEAAAQGRLFTGARARERGLVDATGGLADALERARSEGGLPADAPVERWPGEQSLIDALTGQLGGQARAQRVLRELGGQAGARLGHAAWLPALLGGRERVALTLPYVVRID